MSLIVWLTQRESVVYPCNLTFLRSINIFLEVLMISTARDTVATSFPSGVVARRIIFISAIMAPSTTHDVFISNVCSTLELLSFADDTGNILI